MTGTSKKRVEKKDYERGRRLEITLKQPFTLNGNRIIKALIEIDHINYGLDKKTFKLNKKKRSDFTVDDIEKFLSMLDGEYLSYKKIRGRNLRFEVKISSPVPGRNFGREYVLVFETSYDGPSLIHTITLFPGW